MAKYSESELNKSSKKMLVDLLLPMQDQRELMNRNIELLTEQIRIANQKKFGRYSEKWSMTDNSHSLTCLTRRSF